MKLLSVFLFLSLFISCGDIDDSDMSENDSNEKNESHLDTNLTPAETFSLSLVQEILDEEDEDLQIFLEKEFFPLASNSPKVTIDKISSSIYILSFQSDTVMKNFLIQKFYIPAKDEFAFEKNEIDFDAADKLVKE